MRFLHGIILAIVLLSGCKSDAEVLVDLRKDLRARMDELYAAYGGSGLVSQANPNAGSADAESSTLARVVGELDRSYFEGFCLARGRGERPFSLSGKLDAFMKNPASETACGEAARLAARIADLEAKAGR